MKTSYQKLKEKNEKLEDDIYKLIRGTFFQKESVIQYYELKYAIADSVFFGDCEAKGQGFYDMMLANYPKPDLKKMEIKSPLSDEEQKVITESLNKYMNQIIIESMENTHDYLGNEIKPGMIIKIIRSKKVAPRFTVLGYSFLKKTIRCWETKKIFATAMGRDFTTKYIVDVKGNELLMNLKDLPIEEGDLLTIRGISDIEKTK